MGTRIVLSRQDQQTIGLGGIGVFDEEEGRVAGLLFGDSHRPHWRACMDSGLLRSQTHPRTSAWPKTAQRLRKVLTKKGETHSNHYRVRRGRWHEAEVSNTR